MSAVELRDNRHYQAISELYSRRRAERSGRLLIAHIDEGLALLEILGADLRTKEAYCLHPLLQSDAALTEALKPGSVLERHRPHPFSVALSMHYRALANAYLSPHCRGPKDRIDVGRSQRVRLMLTADKIQNRRDFRVFHQDRHPESARLARYFANWLAALGLSSSRIQRLTAAMPEPSSERGD